MCPFFINILIVKENMKKLMITSLVLGSLVGSPTFAQESVASVKNVQEAYWNAYESFSAQCEICALIRGALEARKNGNNFFKKTVDEVRSTEINEVRSSQVIVAINNNMGLVKFYTTVDVAVTDKGFFDSRESRVFSLDEVAAWCELQNCKDSAQSK